MLYVLLEYGGLGVILVEIVIVFVEFGWVFILIFFVVMVFVIEVILCMGDDE